MRVLQLNPVGAAIETVCASKRNQPSTARHPCHPSLDKKPSHSTHRRNFKPCPACLPHSEAGCNGLRERNKVLALTNASFYIRYALLMASRMQCTRHQTYQLLLVERRSCESYFHSAHRRLVSPLRINSSVAVQLKWKELLRWHCGVNELSTVPSSSHAAKT